MKKTIFLGIAVLLALAVFSCGDPSLPKDEDNAGGITLVGPEFAGGRALIPTVAQAGTDFYEATFEKLIGSPPYQIIRTTWSYARKGKIQLEPGDYNVILMAGRNSDKTLLGVGQVTASNPAQGVSFDPAANLTVTIAANTSYLTFSVYPLTNDINGENDGTTTFTTTLTAGTALSPTLFTQDELGNTVPVFMIGKGAATSGTWKFLIGTSDQTTLLGTRILVDGTPAIYEVGFSAPDTRDVPQKLTAKLILTPASGSNISAGTISISATAPNDDGMVKIALDVPVVAFAAAAGTDKPTTWFIRGGLNNGDIDAGITPNFAKAGKIGGAIVLGFGNLSNFPVIDLIPSSWVPATP